MKKKSQAQSDFEYPKGLYGAPYDMCGAICNTDLFYGLLRGELTRDQVYVGLIEGFWEQGCDTSGGGYKGRLPDASNPVICEIIERYNIDVR